MYIQSRQHCRCYSGKFYRMNEASFVKPDQTGGYMMVSTTIPGIYDNINQLFESTLIHVTNVLSRNHLFQLAA